LAVFRLLLPSVRPSVKQTRPCKQIPVFTGTDVWIFLTQYTTMYPKVTGLSG